MRRLQYALTPEKRRVALKVRADGRYLTFLLLSLHRLGYALQIFDSPHVYRELLCLSGVAQLPFRLSQGVPSAGAFLMTDDPDCGSAYPERRLLLDADCFNPTKKGLPRMPYFMHPSALYRAMPETVETGGNRCVRLGFFGSHDAAFYEPWFRFPILSRTPILNALLETFASEILHVQGPPTGWGRARIALALDGCGGDRSGKTFLRPEDYFAGLKQCDFFLSPPGWCMPVSHNLIEAMMSGAIPILNHPESLEPPLRHGLDCLVFTDLEGLKEQVRTALAMSQDQIQRMRAAVLAYVHEHLKPGVWWGRCLLQRPPVVLINNEEISVALRDNSARGKQA